jgi:hypothetical protein
MPGGRHFVFPWPLHRIRRCGGHKPRLCRWVWMVSSAALRRRLPGCVNTQRPGAEVDYLQQAAGAERLHVSCADLTAATCADNLLRSAWAATLLIMKRQLIAIIVMLAIALQGSAVALAGISTHCQAAGVSHSATSQDSCCPKGQHTMSCCLTACVGSVAGAVTTAPEALKRLGSATLLPQLRSTRFSSRGDSPLIRPPIL